MNPAQTIHGSYDLATMPDGSKKLVALVTKNGKPDWEFVEKRIQDQKEFEERFMGSETEASTKPSDWNPRDTDILIPVPKIRSILPNIQAPSTRANLEARIIEVIGSKEHHLDERTDRLKKLKASNRQAWAIIVEMIRILDDPEWNKVLEKNT